MTTWCAMAESTLSEAHTAVCRLLLSLPRLYALPPTGTAGIPLALTSPYGPTTPDSLQLSWGCPPSLPATAFAAPGVEQPRALFIFYLAGSSPSSSTSGDRAHATSATGPLLPGHAKDPTSVMGGGEAASLA